MQRLGQDPTETDLSELIGAADKNGEIILFNLCIQSLLYMLEQFKRFYSIAEDCFFQGRLNICV